MPRNGSRRARRTRAQWTEVLQRFDISGLGPHEFCRREGLAVSTLQRWRNQIGRTPAAAFVELTPASTPSTPEASWTIELSLPNGVCLRMQA